MSDECNKLVTDKATVKGSHNNVKLFLAFY